MAAILMRHVSLITVQMTASALIHGLRKQSRMHSVSTPRWVAISKKEWWPAYHGATVPGAAARGTRRRLAYA
jgi:hypothetical protein